jgi:hypothetical protein
MSCKKNSRVAESRQRIGDLAERLFRGALAWA